MYIKLIKWLNINNYIVFKSIFRNAYLSCNKKLSFTNYTFYKYYFITPNAGTLIVIASKSPSAE